jgi:tetratricopeptide (TPR) repeat protein
VRPSEASAASLRRVSAAALLCLLCATAAFPAAARLTPAELERHLADGEENFRKATELDRTEPEAALEYYQKSILHLERIVEDGGINNAKLFYDIGNAYFRRGDIGRAILNYKRAALYTPNDPNLKQNLEFARSRRADTIEKLQREKVFKTLFFLHYDLPSHVKLAVLSYAFAAVWVLAAAILFSRRRELRIALVAASILCAVFLASLVVESVGLIRRPEGVIVAGEVIARKGDAETYEPSFTEPLHAGTEFNVLGRRSAWLHVELENGDRCWLPAGAAELVLH